MQAYTLELEAEVATLRELNCELRKSQVYIFPLFKIHIHMNFDDFVKTFISMKMQEEFMEMQKNQVIVLSSTRMLDQYFIGI